MTIVLQMDRNEGGHGTSTTAAATARAAKRDRQRARVARAIRAIERQVSEEAYQRENATPATAAARRETVRLNPAVIVPCDDCGGHGFVPTHLGDGGSMVNCRECGGRGLVSGPPPGVLEAFLRESVDLGHLVERIEQAADEALAEEAVALDRGDWHALGMATAERCVLRSVAAAMREVMGAAGDGVEAERNGEEVSNRPLSVA